MANLLVVDDSKVIRDMMKVMLEGAGHKVTVAETGIEALDLAQSQNYDMVFSDINMPKMSGITMVGELRKLAGYEHTPIVMVTTESADYRKQKAKVNGASGWLEKPITEDRLFKAIERLL